jgi:PQQ-dependent dehydrogenase (methanol/ethanol family)
MMSMRSMVAMLGMMGLIAAGGCTSAKPMTKVIPQWAFYNGDLSGQRYSTLKEINRGNASALQVVCQRTLEKNTAFETGPVLVGDRMFLTTGDSTFALDARDCSVIWQVGNSSFKNDAVLVNRGVAFLDGRLFRGTTDGYVIALDAATGSTLWSEKVLRPDKGERFTMAPVAWHGKVFIGDAVSDNGIQGQVMAFDAVTGRALWRRSTIDAPSWPRGAQTGGGGVWSSFAIDERRAELFVPVSNPAPDFVPAARPGRNLYTDSVLVLDANTGRVKWFYQVTPNDEHDWDLGAAPMLFTLHGREIVAAASKDGYLYTIDRRSHSLLHRTEVTTVKNADLPLSTKYLHVCPGMTGGVEWNGPTFDRLNEQIVVGAVDWCGRYFQTPDELHGGYAPDRASNARGWINAIDARTGMLRWRYHARQPVVGGITSTAGNVVFAGDTADEFFVFDSASGRRVYERQVAGAVAGGIVTYAIAGRQYVAVATGPTLRTTFTDTGDPTITILSLPGS